jgi:pyruvate dehydrogenase E1 component alpha subunit
VEQGWASSLELNEVRKRIRREVDEAVSWAEASPYPDPSTLLDDVYGS